MPPKVYILDDDLSFAKLLRETLAAYDYCLSPLPNSLPLRAG
jgi:hypothetical protein